MSGADLPPPEHPIDTEAFFSRWPTGAETIELWNGCPYFAGDFDERDVAVAQRAFPGREVVLADGAIIICPAGQPDRYRQHDHGFSHR
ncbi:hypothetical protein [Goodfellowiella coeruleoviolacea]|uniref:Uncharacterized protein n=1 Tax=Goodfellowiella coeruleoviolacea TaxID=334858 RepID=A0AAE3KEV1_9PSEU|nr:hypothetical protein [Goodfellowiella coeruleoviolacea]MCP2164272.1 hypothetical protein [Goodfellowiella coeruleoviolacea]